MLNVARTEFTPHGEELFSTNIRQYYHGKVS